jgi:hypothetical protein
MTVIGGIQSLPSDRAAVEQTARDLILAVAGRRTSSGVSVVIEGAPGIGKTFLARRILESVPPGTAKIVRVTGEPGRRNDPFAGARPLLGDMPGTGDVGNAAFDRVDEMAINGHTTRRLPELLLGLAVPGVIILYMLKFSKSYPDRVTGQEPAQAPAH